MLVLIVRHGERADEAARKNGGSLGPRSRKERLDPPLTENGYRQAKSAFEHILPTLAGKRVAVFSSPLKRAIGTAMMIGTALEEQQQTTIEFVHRTSDAIPIVVVNGLGDCASAVQHVGGASRAVYHRYIDCGAMDGNDGSVNSPMRTCLREMLPTAQAAASRGDNDNDAVGTPIQFLKEGYEWNSLEPMTEPLSIHEPVTPQQQQQQQEGSATGDAQSRAPASVYSSSPVFRNEHFIYAANRAVLMATEASCDVCIFVSHREATRYLAWDICRSPDMFSTPYCCVGSFATTVSTRQGLVQWFFRRVVPYESYN